jgi:hypothetical protein
LCPNIEKRGFESLPTQLSLQIPIWRNIAIMVYIDIHIIPAHLLQDSTGIQQQIMNAEKQLEVQHENFDLFEGC